MLETEQTRRSELSPVKRALLERRLRGDAKGGVAKGGSIPRRATNGPAPLSFAQRRLWFAQQLAPDSPLYHISLALRIQGPLDRHALERALNIIVARHESLRTRFICHDEEPVQVVAPSAALVLPPTELTGPAGTDQDSELLRLFKNEIGKAFDLSTDLPLRALLVKLGPAEHALLMTVHHIVSDGWSMGLLARELMAAYEASVAGKHAALSPLPIQYPDFAVWQRRWMQGDVLESQLEWWKRQIAGAPDLLELPADRPRPPVQSFRGHCRWKTFPQPLSDALKALSSREGTTLFMTLLAAFQTLVHRFTRQADVLIGTPVAGRNRSETEGLIGLFVNMLPLRSRHSGEPTFLEFLRRTRDETLEAFAHQDLPFEKLVEELRPERKPGYSPLIQVVFSLQNAPGHLLAPRGLAVTVIPEREVDTGTAKFDLTFQMEDSEAGLGAVVEYNTDLFDETTIDRLLESFEVLLEGIVANPNQSVATLPFLAPAERQRLLVDWNETRTRYPRDKTIPELFAAQAARNPAAAAVIFEGQRLTYRQLDQRANQLGNLLRKLGVGPNVLVAVCLDRSAEMAVALLGILKAGGAYLSLDASYPRERLAFMLEDARATVLLTQQKLKGVFQADEPAAPLKVICLDSDSAAVTDESTAPPDFDGQPPGPTDLAYVSYTSGSTGQPKGVCIPHRAVVRLLFNTDYLQLNASDTVAQISNCAFDASTFEIWGALLHGGRLVILPQQTVLSAQALAREIRDWRITAMFVTTALFNQLSREAPEIFRPVRCLLFGGEAANPACVRDVLKNGPPSRLLHVYGPTEATTFTTRHEVREVEADAASIPIGRPIANTELYVLDELRQPVPMGVTGELYIGGDGLARGYLNRPELTAERFVPHPFTNDVAARLYKTGDLVRYRADGNLEFVGRADGQVKLRGFRVELGEIETALNQHPGVRECAVAVFQDSSGDKRLAAYLVAKSASPTQEELRDFLRMKLPDYMVPSAFVFLSALPLNANGKVDRHALPAPEAARSGQKTFVAARNQMESQLIRIWEELLTVRPIGALDNFFDLGGHSLLAIRLLARIEKIFDKSIPVSAIFQSPTIAQLATILGERKAEHARPESSIVEIQPRGSKPPLFLVHGAGGGMLWGYSNLARYLGSDQPVYSFKSGGRDFPEGFATIEDMAARFVCDLRAFQPRGPYHLGGYCFGGNVAYEMARQLQAQSEEVALLALMNSTPTDPTPSAGGPKLKQLARFCSNLVYHARCFFSRPLAEQRRFLTWRARALTRRISRWLRRQPAPSGFDVEELVDLSIYSPEQRWLWEAHIRALVEHHTQPYSGPVTLFRSRGHHFGVPLDYTYGWNGFANRVAVRFVSGAHEQILDEPHAETLAEELAKCLEEVYAERGLKAASLHELKEHEDKASARNGSPVKRAEVRVPLAEWNDTHADYPREKCVHHLFEEQVERTPNAVAVLFGEERLTYRELDQRANQLAGALQTLGVRPDAPVGLCLDRSLEMVIGVLAILKAGGAYVPLDPAYPRERLQLMLENSRAPVLLTRQSLRGHFQQPLADCQVLCVDDTDHAPRTTHHASAINSQPPISLAYVIHTSGSTGTPKGVAMPHQPLVNLITWQLKNSRLAPGARTLQFTSLSFDVSFQELFSTWCAGGTLVLVDDELRRDPFALLRFIAEQKIERLFLPFVGLQQLAEAYRENAPAPCLREVITAGEQLQITPAIVKLFEGLPDCTLHNQYGPTESHVVTAFTLSGPPSQWPALPPIGRPIANTQIHLLDPDRRPVAIGAEGELYIGGDCLARGYLHRPDLTAERFIPNPFSTDSNAKLYKTGDRGRWLPDGNIEYLGRMDHQVKIRGYRIELQEIEAALSQHPSVRECAVAAREDTPGEKRLVAYVVVGEKETSAIEQDLRASLQQRLPEYMLPSAFVFLDALPLTPTGKVNRRALPAPRPSFQCDDLGAAPRTPTEKSLAEIWRAVLGLERVGVRHNFFEVGGHSLLAVQMVKRIESAFGRQLSVATIFQSPTIEKLAAVLEQGEGRTPSATSIVEIQPNGSKPPLYLVHGAGGGMFWGYTNLSRHLGADQPIYVCNSRGLDGREEMGTIEEMAAQYVTDLRAFQPEGPYRLGGYCFGGNVAYEMARQLEAQGQKVALLAVFNAWPPNSSYTRARVTPAFCFRFLKNLRYWAGYVLRLKPEQQRELLIWKARAAGRKWLRFANRLRAAAPDIDVAEWVDLSAQPEDRHELWATHIRAYLEHHPKPFRGHLTLFRTRCHPLFCSFDDACGWRDLAGSGVTVHVVPGAHESVLDEPHVAPLARELKRELEATEDEPKTKDTGHPPVTLSVGNGSRSSLDKPALPLMADGEQASPSQPDSTTRSPTRHLHRTRNKAALLIFILLLIVIFPALLRARIRQGFRSKVLAGLIQSQLRTSSRNDSRQNVQTRDARGPMAPKGDWSAASVVELIEAQSARTPDAVAVAGRRTSLTYRELNLRADQLAGHLRALGVGPETMVGICLNRSCRMALAVLGVLKAGGAYVPMDPAYPRERLQAMIEGAQMRVLVTDESLRSRLPKPTGHCQLVCLDDPAHASRLANHEPQIVNRAPSATSLAYVIYTSGSTGRPKGVLISHAALVNHSVAVSQAYQLSPGDRVLQFASLSFDVAAEELFPAWLRGATVVLRSENCTDSIDRFLHFVERERISVLNLPASWWHELVDELERSQAPLPPSVRLVVTGNERVLPDALTRWRKLTSGRVRWLNAYGPTEATITATLYEPEFSSPLPETSSVPIGRPIANVHALLLDEQLRAVPDGEPGELHLGGAGLARGYLNRPELTAAKFIRNPFSDEPGARLYKTGDRARVLPDGNLEFIGRIDEQIKIRGFRIEPGEVELALLAHPSISQAAVVAREDQPGDKRLVAYFVPASGQSTNAQELRAFLREKLPDYMVPAHFVRLEEMPRTPNGKVDRNGLPAPEITGPNDEFIAPRDDFERQLAAIWEEALNVRPIGLRQHFFELGGNSLLAARIVALIDQQFSKDLSVAAIFRSPTVEQLAALLRDGEPQGPSPASFSIVEIQPHGSAPPLFLVHGIGGGMFWGYANLARYLGTEQPIFAFKSRGLDGLEEFSTIEEMATQYVADLRAFRPHGPYRLGGYCFGGNVAYEMARQLDAQGERVALLALFNCPAQNSSYDRIRPTPAFCWRFLRNLGHWTAHVMELAPEQRRGMFQWKARALAKKWSCFFHGSQNAPEFDVDEWVDLSAQPEERHELWATHMQAYLRHRPKPYSGRVTLFRTPVHPLFCSFDHACGWRELASGGVSVHLVPGAHESILDEPHVKNAADALQSCLRDIEAS